MKSKTLTISGGLLAVIGLVFWVMQLRQGFVVTGLSNAFVWGLYIGSFELFVGLSSGGMLLYSLAYCFGQDGLKPFARLGLFTSLGCTVAAGISILADLGQPMRVLNMILYANVSSPLFWDVCMLSIYAIYQIVALVLLQKGKQDSFGKLSKLALPLVVAVNMVTALLFAVQNTREWWNSALLPIDSVAVGVGTGLALMLLICAVAAKDKGAFGLPARIASGALLLHIGLQALELAVLSWRNTAESRHLMQVIAQNGLLYAAELIALLIAAVLLLKKSGQTAILAGALAIVGGLAHRMMLFYPAFGASPTAWEVEGAGLWTYPVARGVFREGQRLFVTQGEYLPSLTECAVMLLPLGILLLAIGLALGGQSKAKQS